MGPSGSSKTTLLKIMGGRLTNNYLQLRYRTDLEPKEKEENPRNRKETEHLQIGIQVKKDWALSWWDQYIILSR
ncbi:hypothetical protein YC2023_062491 [Brassica napus]